MFCNRCGKEIKGGSKFCSFCGNAIERSSVPKESGEQEKIQNKTSEKQEPKKPLPVKLIAGGAAAVVLLMICIIIFRPAGNKVIEDSFLGRMFSLSWSEISDMTARDFRNLFKEEDIACLYKEGSSSGWSLVTKEPSRFMESDALCRIEADIGTYAQIFMLLYETREDCKDSYENIMHYLDNNLGGNTTAVDLLSFSGKSRFSEMDIVLWDSDVLEVRNKYGYLIDKSSKEADLEKYLELSLQKAEQEGKELSDEDIEELKKEIDESVIYKQVVLLRGEIEDLTAALGDSFLDDKSYSKSICVLAVTYKLKKEADVIVNFASLGWDALSGREIDIEDVKDSVNDDIRQIIEKLYEEIKNSFYMTYITDETKLDIEDSFERYIYSALYMMDKHNYDIFKGQYVKKKAKNFWYITTFGYDMDKKEVVDLSEYVNSRDVYCAVEYNYDVRNSEKFASDKDREIFLASKGYDINSESELDLSGYMNSGRIYCAVNYNYNVDESDYFSSDLDRALYLAKNRYDAATKAPIDLTNYKNSLNIYCAVNYNYNTEESDYFASDFDRALYLADRDYNIDTGDSFGGHDIMRLWFLLSYGYDIDSGETIKAYANWNLDKEVVKALVAYQKSMSDGDIIFNGGYDSIGNFREENYYGGDFSWCLAYIDEDDIPELILQIDVMISTYILIISNHHDNLIVNEIDGCYAGAVYAEKKNIVGVSEGRMGYYSDRFYQLIDGKADVLSEGFYNDKYEDGHYVTDEDGTVIQEYFWNNIECSEDDYYNSIDNLMNSIGDAVEWKAVPQYREFYSDILSAFEALHTTTYTVYIPQIAEFEMSNGMLTVSTNDGTRYGWESRPLNISYPVAEDCIWERGYYLDDFVHESDTDYESIKGGIISDQEYYEELIRENGEEWFLEFRPINSPTGINIVVMDGVVVRVYTTHS